MAMERRVLLCQPRWICLLGALSCLSASEKARPTTQTQRSREMEMKARCNNTVSLQNVTCFLLKMLISHGKSGGSNNRIAEPVWRVLPQAKLHQQVFILSVEDDKDARCFGVGSVWWNVKEMGDNGKRKLLLVTHHGSLSCQGGRSGGLRPWSSGS